MSGSFSGYPETKWVGDRDMVLTKPMTYTDPEGREWKAPKGSEVNGATIPKALWSTIGSPFIGKYRRASVVHDYFVGEGKNPDVSRKARRKADKMFYHACRTDGCSRRYAAILYIGVSVGTWSSGFKRLFPALADARDESLEESPADAMLRKTFQRIVTKLEDRLDEMSVDELEKALRKEF